MRRALQYPKTEHKQIVFDDEISNIITKVV